MATLEKIKYTTDRLTRDQFTSDEMYNKYNEQLDEIEIALQ